jgi:competence protein ComFC
LQLNIDFSTFIPKTRQMPIVQKLKDEIFSPLIDFIYPPVCISCNRMLNDGNQKVCVECWNAIPAISEDHQLYKEAYGRLITEGDIDNLVSAYIFESQGPFQHIAHALKYREYKSLGIELGKRIGGLLQARDIDADVIVPVPLHKIKQRERGYNQSEFIARGISSIIKKPVETGVISRIRYTQTQTKLNHDQRRENLKDAFRIDINAKVKLEDKKCLLVDDVITTGATTNECAKELLKAGVSKIIAASAAIAT